MPPKNLTRYPGPSRFALPSNCPRRGCGPLPVCWKHEFPRDLQFQPTGQDVFSCPPWGWDLPGTVPSMQAGAWPLPPGQRAIRPSITPRNPVRTTQPRNQPMTALRLVSAMAETPARPCPSEWGQRRITKNPAHSGTGFHPRCHPASCHLDRLFGRHDFMSAPG